MTYFHALGAVPRDDWCSDRNPRSACRGGPNICSPRFPRTLELFRQVQEEVNRVARARGFSRVAVDGDIGPETISGVNRALGRSYSRCEEIASQADSVRTALRAAANAAGAGRLPDQTDPLPPEIDPDDPSSTDRARKAMNLEPTKSGLVGMLTSPIGIAALVGGAVLTWVALDDEKKRRKRA